MLTVGDKHILGGRPLGLRRAEHKAVAKERMGRVNNFDLGQIVLREGVWVVERGINPTTLTLGIFSAKIESVISASV